VVKCAFCGKGTGVIVETKVIGRAAEQHDRQVAAAGASTLRGLLTELVRAELEGYEQRRADKQVLRLLNAADLADGYASGTFSSAPRRVPAAPGLDEALARAVEAFEDGQVLVLLDGAQVADLDTPLTIAADSRIRLVRLVALAGG
jgi:hypothetical protein